MLVNKNTINSENTIVLQEYLPQVQLILGQRLIGLYIGGSIANNSFNSITSDIDCYIVTTSSLPENVTAQIEKLHYQLYKSDIPYAKKLEVSYISINDLEDFKPENTRPYFNEGNFYQATYGSNFIIELFMLRSKGINIVGSPIKELMKEISTQDLLLAIKKNLDDYWQVMVSDVAKLSRSDYQVFAILTMCRTLYSIEKKDITSKAEAAKWVIDNYNDWEDLIVKAIGWEPGFELNKLQETQRLINFVLNKFSS